MENIFSSSNAVHYLKTTFAECSEVKTCLGMEEVYRQLSRYVLPTTIIFGTIGAISNQILFQSRRSLRTTSCALYFRALSANDLLVLWFVMLSEWLRDQWHIDATVKFSWYCKCAQYLTYTFYNLSPYFVVLACFDRLCTSSTNARLRKIATIRIASFLIPLMIIIIFAAYFFVPYWCQLVTTPLNDFCAIIDPVYREVLAFSLLFLFCLLPPLLMIIFCSITLILLRQQRHRIMPANQAGVRHRDYQLLKMLFIYVTSNIACIAPFTVAYFIQIYYYENPAALEHPLVQIFIILVNITYATSFYIYTLSTPFYRDELRHLLTSIWQRLRGNENGMLNLQLRRNPNSTVA